ncbi:hypothetical protein HA422_24390 [Klebsiella pneumoniae]|uniref:Uncharacterized protein n=1 Tax=Klebsiella pneumoniae TaxID=573 RepID=A0A6H0A908_KLEPN|nr:hypothetical protein [Klebsiella pneumoniae]MBD0882866.1 hypothetical protein [Klebsiella pneumoniae]MBD0887951.1 hypothetical protein [Klebsiella pneumoniae]MBD0895322.1 hypothetical protein [Klebsiella pneumoniae]MBD0900473.1 hypothetical protein [Klebsiella pneumoniae]
MPVIPRSPGVNASLPHAACSSRPVWYGTGGFSAPARRR